MAELPPLPPGFTLDRPQAQALPPLPPGFTLDSERSAPQATPTDFGRVAALGGRAVGEGAASAGIAPADMALGISKMPGVSGASPATMALKIIQDVTGKTPAQITALAFNKAFGIELPDSETFGGLLSDTLTQSGAPAPETDAEKLGFQAVKGAAAAATGGAALGAARPLMTAASGATGAAAGEATRQAGGGPLLQTAATIAGGLTPYAATEGAKALGRGGAALAEPLFAQGRDKIVGRVLNEAATDPVKARANMANAAELVPGSKPTAAEVSKDYGIISTQRAAKATNPAAFAERSSEQNTARNEFLGVAAKDQKALGNLVKRRDEVTTKLRNDAFEQAKGKQVDNAALIKKIDDMIADPENAGETTQKALQWARAQLEGKTDPRAVYAVRKDIANKIAGQVESDQSVLRYAGKELSAVRGLIDEGIQAIAPAWKSYLLKYRQLSKPIDRMTNLQEAQGRSSLGTVDAQTQLPVFSPAKWRSQVGKLIEDGGLTKGQQERIKRISDDLQRGAALNDPNIRAVGSNTTQDMTAANVLGQALGSTKMTPLVRTLMRPLQWIYKIPEAEMQAKLAEALLDPRLGAALMQKASASNMTRISTLLRERFVAAGLGTGAAEVTQQLRSPEQREAAGQ